MSRKKLNIMHKQDILVPARAVERLMDTANGDAALVYLYILSHDGELDEESACKRLKFRHEALCAAVDALKKQGLISFGCDECQVDEKADTPPEFSPTDIHTMLDTDSSFFELVKFTQQQLGKILTNAELEALARITRHVGLPADVVFLLVSSCVSEAERLYGEGRKPTVRTLERTASRWEKLGLFNCELAEAFLKEQEKRSERVSQISRLLFISTRPLSETEGKYLKSWAEMGLCDELILAAYDNTVINTGKLTWKYMNTILKGWHASGFKTLQDVAQAEKLRKASSTVPKQDELDSLHRLREINKKRRGEANDL